MNKSHLVTGAAGLIGFELTKQLITAGDSVVAIDNFRKGGKADLNALEKSAAGRLRIVEADLVTDISHFESFGRFDTIFHLAAIVGVAYVNKHPYETVRVNCLSTFHLLDFAIRSHPRALIFASSSENYASGVEQGWVTLPTAEDVPLCIDDIRLPRWSYASSKIAGESAVFAAAELAGFAPIVVRFHNVYGPRMGLTHVIPELLERFCQKVDPLPVYGFDASRTFLYVEDACRALRLLSTRDSGLAGGIYNIGSPDEVTIAELVDQIARVTDFSPKLEKHPAPPGSVRRRVPNVDRLKQLGFTPEVSLSDGIERCYRAKITSAGFPPITVAPPNQELLQ